MGDLSDRIYGRLMLLYNHCCDHLQRGDIAMKRYSMAALVCMLSLFFVLPAFAATGGNKSIAEDIAKLLGEKFNPENVSVTVLDSHAYAEMHGAILSKIRIDTMRLEAMLNDVPASVSGDANSLSRYIALSKGEIVLTEKDVNDYFAKNEKGGFSKLAFNFTNKGFKASGKFTGTFLITLTIRLDAEGVLALQSDGVYLDNVSIFVEKIKQPQSLTDQIIKRVNPLVEFKDIPFPVTFKKITMNDTEAKMTGFPQKFNGGVTAVWKRP